MAYNQLSRTNQIEELFFHKFKLNPQLLSKRQKLQYLPLTSYLTEYFTQAVVDIEDLLKKKLKIDVKCLDKETLKKFIKKLIKPTNNSQIINIFRQYIVTFANYQYEKQNFDTVQFARIYSMIVRCQQQFNAKEDMEFIQALSTMTEPQLAQHIKRNSKAGTYSFKPLQQRSLRQQLIEYGLKIKAISSPSHSTLYNGAKKAFYQVLTYMSNHFKNKFKIDMSKSYFEFTNLQKLFVDLVKVEKSIKQATFLRKWLTKSYIAINGDKQHNISPKKIPLKRMIRIYCTFLKYKRITSNINNDPKSKQPYKKNILWSHLDDWKIKQLLKQQITYKDIASLFKMQQREDKKLSQRRILIRTKSLMAKAVRNIFYQCYQVDQADDKQITQISMFLMKNLVNGCLREDAQNVLKFEDNNYKDEDAARQILEIVRKKIDLHKLREIQRKQKQKQEIQLKKQKQRIKQQQDRYQKEGAAKDNANKLDKTTHVKKNIVKNIPKLQNSQIKA